MSALQQYGSMLMLTIDFISAGDVGDAVHCWSCSGCGGGGKVYTDLVSLSVSFDLAIVR